jgi:hypothetical protein
MLLTKTVNPENDTFEIASAETVPAHDCEELSIFAAHLLGITMRTAGEFSVEDRFFSRRTLAKTICALANTSIAFQQLFLILDVLRDVVKYKGDLRKNNLSNRVVLVLLTECAVDMILQSHFNVDDKKELCFFRDQANVIIQRSSAFLTRSIEAVLSIDEEWVFIDKSEPIDVDQKGMPEKKQSSFVKEAYTRFKNRPQHFEGTKHYKLIENDIISNLPGIPTQFWVHLSHEEIINLQASLAAVSKQISPRSRHAY